MVKLARFFQLKQCARGSITVQLSAYVGFIIYLNVPHTTRPCHMEGLSQTNGCRSAFKITGPSRKNCSLKKIRIRPLKENQKNADQDPPLNKNVNPDPDPKPKNVVSQTERCGSVFIKCEYRSEILIKKTSRSNIQSKMLIQCQSKRKILIKLSLSNISR